MTKSNSYRNGLFYGCAAAVLLIVASNSDAVAQEPNDTAVSGSLDEIIVTTARRRTESLQEVPVAVTALSQDLIRQQGLTTAADLRFATPSFQLQPALEGRQAARFYIRGQGVGFGGALPSVVAYFNEVPLDPNGGALFALNDLEQVQILRGPQGTLFGRNANGGAVVLQPKAPGNEFEGFGEVTIGNYNARSVKGGVTLPLIEDKLTIRLSGQFTKRDGYTENLIGGDLDDLDNASWRVFARWTPTDFFTNDLVYNGMKAESNGVGAILDTVRPGSVAATLYPTGGLPFEFGTGLANDLVTQQALGPRTVRAGANTGEEVNVQFVSNAATFEFEQFTLKSITGYQDVSACPSIDITSTETNFFQSTCFDDFPWRASVPAPAEVNPTFDYRTISQEINLSGTAFGDRMDWILGGFALWLDPTEGNIGEQHTTRASKSFIFANVTTSLQEDRTQAVYAQVSYDLLEDLSFTAGGRYTWDQRTQQFGQVNSPANGVAGTFSCATPGLPASTPVESCFNVFDDNFSGHSYTFGLDWQAQEDLLLYAATRRSYKSGGFNTISVNADPLYDPETVRDVEVGAKYQFDLGDVNGTLNAAYFHMWYDDVQTQLVAVVSGVATVVVANAGEATIQGVEAEWNLNFFENFNVSGFYSFLEGSYGACDSTPTPDECFVDRGVDASDSELLNLPGHTVSVTARYSTPIPNVGDFDLSGTYYYQTSKAYAGNNVSNFEAFAPAYDIFNIRAELSNIAGHDVSVAAFANNVFNEDYVLTGYGLGSLLGTNSQVYGDPRLFGVNVRYGF